MREPTYSYEEFKKAVEGIVRDMYLTACQGCGEIVHDVGFLLDKAHCNSCLSSKLREAEAKLKKKGKK